MEAIIQVLNEMAGDGIVADYAIGGAIAVSFYTEPQETLDIDIFVAFPAEEQAVISMQPVYDYLEKKGHKASGEHISIHGMPVQFLPTDELTGDALANAEHTTVGDLPTRVFTKEHLAAIMVKLQRPKDRARLPALLDVDDFDSGVFEAILERFGLAERWAALRRRLYE